MKQFVLPILCGILLCMNSKARAQDDSTKPGIRFDNALKWDQILAKAKVENKYVFVDCYTTWCLPCKKMEQDVYPLKNVGDFFNSKFVAVKFQMDVTPKDNDIVKSRYADANKIKDDYSVDGFPTYLIFTPDGRLLYRYSG